MAAQRNHPRGSIALGVTGGIAAYKAAALTRLLTRDGYTVWPIMTRWGAQFLGPLTLESLSGHPVRIDTPSAGDVGGIEHISLIRQADLLLIAPLTANTLAKMAQGQADNFLTTTYLAHTGPTMVCPAMNRAMLAHPATQRNLATLAADGAFIMHGAAGELACGETGAGRMAEPADIMEAVHMLTGTKLPPLQDKRVLVTAGPTREDLDPVRFLTNRSSGKMGLAIARAFRDAGAQVTLVHGPINDPLPGFIDNRGVVAADEMAQVVLDTPADIVVMAAAVADYKPERHDQKLKKHQFHGQLELQRTTDILAALGERRAANGSPTVLVGFAAETNDVLDHARDKLKRKGLDMIFANDVSNPKWGFRSNDNRLWAIDRHGRVEDMGEHPKAELGRRIVHRVASFLDNERT